MIRKILSIIFPPKCLQCRNLVLENGLLCIECWNKISFLSEPSCEICGIPFEFDINSLLVCGKCLEDKPFFDSAFSLFRYNQSSQNIIQQFKYNDRPHLSKYLAKWLFARVGNKLQEYDYIIPVPMHRQRLKKRFYNQAALLAQSLSELADVKFAPNLLIKHKPTLPQTGLGKVIRLKNMRNSFSLNESFSEKIIGANIVLIDDVYTTGSTLNECSRILKESKCNKIQVITLARVY